MSCARNEGIKTIFGKYIGFVDSDDMLAPGAIQAWLDAAYKTNADIVEGSFRRMTPYGKLYGGFVQGSSSLHYGFVWTRIFKSYLFENIHFPEKYWFEDSIVSGLLVPCAHKCEIIKDYVYYYRTNPDSLMHTFVGNPKSLDSLYITKSILKDAKKVDCYDFNSNYAIDFLLRMAQHNWHRTHSLGFDVECAVYESAKIMLTEYFPNNTTNVENLKTLELALRTDNFNVYRRECCYMQ